MATRLQMISELMENGLRYKQEFQEAKEAYLKAKKLHESITKIDEESKISVLQGNIFKVDETDKYDAGKRIFDPIEDFQMSEEDFKVYMNLCHTERTKRGLTIPSAELSSDYESHKLLRAAEDTFIDLILKISPEEFRSELETAKYHWKFRQQIIELGLTFKLEEQ